MILEQIQSDLKEAMKSGDQTRVSVLRFVLSAIKNKIISNFGAAGGDLSEEEIIQVITKQAKERKESIEAFRSARREDLASKEEAELAIVNNYLPQQLSGEELEKIVQETITEIGAAGQADFGRVMKAVMEKVRGQADGNQVSGLVKKLLT